MQHFAKNETSTQNDEQTLFQNFKKSMIVCVSFSFFFNFSKHAKIEKEQNVFSFNE